MSAAPFRPTVAAITGSCDVKSMMTARGQTGDTGVRYSQATPASSPRSTPHSSSDHIDTTSNMTRSTRSRILESERVEPQPRPEDTVSAELPGKAGTLERVHERPNLQLPASTGLRSVFVDRGRVELCRQVTPSSPPDRGLAGLLPDASITAPRQAVRVGPDQTATATLASRGMRPKPSTGDAPD